MQLAQEIQGVLEKQGARVWVAYNGAHGISNAKNSQFDLILLDMILPEMTGLEVLVRLREMHKSTPIIMIISSNKHGGIEQYLDAGANDYIVKPISLKEILDKTNTLLGKNRNKEITKSVVYGDIELNFETKSLICASDSINLQDREFQIMALFIYTPEKIYSKQYIIDKFWGENSGVENNNIEVHISLIRKKLKSISAKTIIRTVRGVGYALTISK